MRKRIASILLLIALSAAIIGIALLLYSNFDIMKSVSERGDALLSEIIKLTHNLGVEVVCEGIETKEQNDVAIKNGCERIQGYYYSYVYSTEEAEKYYMEKK